MVDPIYIELWVLLLAKMSGKEDLLLNIHSVSLYYMIYDLL